MKMLSLLLSFACLQLAATGYSQEITISLKNAPLEKAFREIEKQTPYHFFYSTEFINLSHKVTIEVKNESLENVLKLCFNNQPISYSIEDKLIIVKIAEEKKIGENSFHDVRGRVINDNGEPVEGASVVIKGTQRGTTTNSDGEFELKNIEEDAILIISGVSIEPIEITVKGKINVLVNAKTKVSEQREVTINAGYYKVTDTLKTGNIARVDAKTISTQPILNPLEGLEGRMSGVYIQQASGLPGAGFTIQIRGENSLRRFSPDNGNLPLFIIDGVPFTSTSLDENTDLATQILPLTSPLNAINPSDIESIEVLKDADATAIYGSRGANGIVLITTKKGKAGKSKVDINIYSGVAKVTRMINLLNTPQYLQMRIEALKNDGLWPLPPSLQQYVPDVFLWDTTRYTNWQKTLIGGTAHTTNAQAQLSGGNSHVQYLLGVGYAQQGTVFPGGFADKRPSAHFNLNQSSENNRFKATISASYVVDNNNLPFVDPTIQAVRLAPDAPPLLNADGSLNWANSTLPNGNPYAPFLQKYKYTTSNLITNAVLNYEVLSGLQLSTSFGYNDIHMDQTVNRPIRSQNPAQNPTGSTIVGISGINTWIIEPQIEYKRTLGKGKLSILTGSTFQQNVSQSKSLYASGYTDDALIENLQAAPNTRMLSYNYVQYRYNAIYGRVNYTWLDKYLLNLTGRRDGSSRFGPEKRFANFGAFGAGWIFSKENFFKYIKILDYGKLRASYGITGSDHIPDYGYFDTYSPTNDPYNGTTGLTLTRLVNKEFSWETNKKFEIALELSILKNRILLNTSYYHNRSSNQLVGYPLPAITGEPYITANLPAVVDNRGWEIELSTSNVIFGVRWTSSFNLSVPRNKLISYPNLAASAYANVYEVGQPISMTKAFHFIGVDPTTGQYIFATKNNNGNPSYPEDLGVVKNIGQEFYGGFQNNFSWKGVELNIFFQFVKQTGRNYQGAFSAPGSFSNQPLAVLGRWQKPGDLTDIQKFTLIGQASQSYNNAVSSDHRISDASFIRLKNLSLSYQLPDAWLKRIKVEHFRVYFQAQNLLTITNYLGMDPENQSFQSLPPLRILTGGIQITL